MSLIRNPRSRAALLAAAFLLAAALTCLGSAAYAQTSDSVAGAAKKTRLAVVTNNPCYPDGRHHAGQPRGVPGPAQEAACRGLML